MPMPYRFAGRDTMRQHIHGFSRTHSFDWTSPIYRGYRQWTCAAQSELDRHRGTIPYASRTLSAYVPTYTTDYITASPWPSFEWRQV